MTFFSVLLAVAVPTIGPFIGLIGAFCFSLLGLIIPIMIEIVTYWDVGFGPCNWVLFKNFILFVFGVLALVFGSWTSIEEIIAEYSPKNANKTEMFNPNEFLDPALAVANKTLTSLNVTGESILSTVNNVIAAVTNGTVAPSSDAAL